MIVQRKLVLHKTLTLCNGLWQNLKTSAVVEGHLAGPWQLLQQLGDCFGFCISTVKFLHCSCLLTLFLLFQIHLFQVLCMKKTKEIKELRENRAGCNLSKHFCGTVLENSELNIPLFIELSSDDHLSPNLHSSNSNCFPCVQSIVICLLKYQKWATGVCIMHDSKKNKGWWVIQQTPQDHFRSGAVGLKWFMAAGSLGRQLWNLANQTSNRKCFQSVLISMGSITNCFPLWIKGGRYKRACDEREKQLLPPSLKNHRRKPGRRSYYKL